MKIKKFIILTICFFFSLTTNAVCASVVLLGTVDNVGVSFATGTYTADITDLTPEEVNSILAPGVNDNVSTTITDRKIADYYPGSGGRIQIRWYVDDLGADKLYDTLLLLSADSTACVRVSVNQNPDTLYPNSYNIDWAKKTKLTEAPE